MKPISRSSPMKTPMKPLPRTLTALLLVSLGCVVSLPAQSVKDAKQMPVESTAGIAILSGGRVKPLETYADESLRFVSGKSSIGGNSPLQVLWGFHFDPESYRGKAWIRMDSQELKELCGFSPALRRFSFDSLMSNEGFKKVVERANSLRKEEKPLSATQKDALAVYAKMERIAGFIEGNGLTILPRPKEDGSWSSPADLKTMVDPESQAVQQSLARLADAWKRGDATQFSAGASSLATSLQTMGGDLYPARSELDREILYNRLHAYGWAWKAYLLGFLMLLLFGFGDKVWARRAGLVLVLIGFLFHSGGLGLRWAIAGRAPVSDMYESLVFMSWGVMAIGIVLEFVYKTRFFVFGASLMGFLALMFSEHLPLDSSINPLVPVLAHTSWLSIHVMTIMLSYSAFALAMGLAHIVLGIQIFRPGKTLVLRELSSLLYKTLQVGILFLAAGIAFGAIWANESWGRYWGWDPKETWSLITFFVYMIIIHARFAAWIGNFGLAILSITGFLSVVMTYYGVNYILASGLHSYGFSSGGMLYAVLYGVVELAIILGAWLRFRTAVQNKGLAREAAVPTPPKA